MVQRRMQNQLHVRQGKLLDAKGRQVVFHGINLAGWLHAARWIAGWKKGSERGAGSERNAGREDLGGSMELGEGMELGESMVWELLAGRFSLPQAEHLRQIYRRNWIKKEDLANIREMGFNTVRVPFGLSRDLHIKEEDLPYLDEVIAWSAEQGLYCVLDLHLADKEKFWPDDSSPPNLPGISYPKRLCNLINLPNLPNLPNSRTHLNSQSVSDAWLFLSGRYRDASWVLFDLLNEPTYHHYCKPAAATLFSYYQAVHDRLRKAGDDRVLILQDGFKGLSRIEKNGLAPQRLGLENVMHENVAGFKTPPFRATFSAC